MRIYLADTESIILQMLKGFLEDLGHNVLLANSGDQLVHLLMNKRPMPHVVIANVRLDGWNSESLFKRAHAACPDVPFILTTQHGVTLSPKAAVSTGIFAYLRKPILFQELELLLQRVTETRRWERTANVNRTSRTTYTT